MRIRFAALLFLFFPAVFLLGCTELLTRRPRPTSTPPTPVTIVVLQGDSLPAYLYDPLPKMTLRDRELHGDALLISKDVLIQARSDPALRLKLEEVANKVPLFVYQATTEDLAETFPDQRIMTSTSTTTRILASFFRIHHTKEGTIIPDSGSIAVPRDENRSFIRRIFSPWPDEEERLLGNIEDMVRQIELLELE